MRYAYTKSPFQGAQWFTVAGEYEIHLHKTKSGWSALAYRGGKAVAQGRGKTRDLAVSMAIDEMHAAARRLAPRAALYATLIPLAATGAAAARSAHAEKLKLAAALSARARRARKAQRLRQVAELKTPTRWARRNLVKGTRTLVLAIAIGCLATGVLVTLAVDAYSDLFADEGELII